MELNILLILKWLLSGLGLVCFGWLVEDRKSLKHKVEKLEERVCSVDKRQGVIKNKVDNIESTTSSLIDAKLEPIHVSLELLTQSITLMRQDVLSLLNKIEDRQTQHDKHD